MADCKALTEKAESYKDNIKFYLERGAKLLSVTSPTNTPPLDFWRQKINFINNNISGANGEIQRALTAIEAQKAAGCKPTDISSEIAQTKTQQNQLESLKAKAEVEVKKLESEGGLCVQIADKAKALDKSTPSLYDKFRQGKDTVLRKIEGPNAAAEYQNAAQVLKNVVTEAAKVKAQAQELKAQAEKNGCGRDTIDDLADTVNRAAYLEQEGSDFQAQATDKAQKAGGTGPGATGPATVAPTGGAPTSGDGLEEVSVTGKKAPATVTPTGGAPAGDGLEEVSVTGKKTPQTVGGTDGLEEVQVTGKTATDPSSNTNRGLNGQKQDARAQATLQDTTNFEQMQDWRVRLCLSPGADYLYKAPEGQRGILDPLAGSNGVVFPYTPNITVNYMANYDQITPTHSNYKILQYTNSAVDSVTIACDFTAQDTREANYLLAVIHFFRSVTKMFYGQDQFPKPGTPPPLVYLFGLGQFQFNAHPLVITNFTYSLPGDVDYIRAGAVTANPGVNREPSKPAATQTTGSSSSTLGRLGSIVSQIGSNFLNSVLPGGESGPANFTPSGFSAQTPAGTIEPTYVPTKINLQINCTPIVSRNDVSNRFSLKNYASGNLLLGTKNKGGGFW